MYSGILRRQLSVSSDRRDSDGQQSKSSTGHRKSRRGISLENTTSVMQPVEAVHFRRSSRRTSWTSDSTVLARTSSSSSIMKKFGSMLGGKSSASNSKADSVSTPSYQPSFVPYQADPFNFTDSSMVMPLQQTSSSTCTICQEDLSMRLAGERPHVVPQCGHRLHEACFVAVYGPKNKAGPLGLCGVCRKDMRIGDEGDAPGRKNKFAALSGGQQQSEPDFLTRRSPLHFEPSINSLKDSNEDDDLIRNPHSSATLSNRHFGPHPSDPSHRRSNEVPTARRNSIDSMRGSSISAGSLRGGLPGGGEYAGARGSSSREVVKPVVSVRSEYPTIARSMERDKVQHLTCMVTIEMPSRLQSGGERERYDREVVLRRQRSESSLHSRVAIPGKHQLYAGDSSVFPSPPRPLSPNSPSPTSHAYGSIPAASQLYPNANVLAIIVEDLRRRMSDWKGHAFEEFGALKIYDHLNVRKEKHVREFVVYLFEEAILCVTDDRGRTSSGRTIASSDGEDHLRLKGRVYVRHIKNIIDTSHNGELSLTIHMSDDNLDEFVMIFRDRSRLNVWRSQIEYLVALHHSSGPPHAASSGGSKTDGLLSSTNMSPTLSAESARSHLSQYSHESDSSARSAAHSSSFSNYTRTTSSTAPFASTIREENPKDLRKFNTASRDFLRVDPSSATNRPTPTYVIPLTPLVTRDFTPLDLMLVLAVPSSGSSTLKLRIIKNTLDFLLASLGPQARLSIVTFSASEGIRGRIRKTPFLAVGNPDSRKRLELLTQGIGAGSDDVPGMMEVREERVNVGSAVNVALDTILQRKAKSAVTGMLVMSEGKDTTQKQSMDLVMARIEAADIPVHTIGWGHHDPSSLWSLANHSGGTYAYAKGFYDLRDTVAGCVGSMLSIAATNVKLHISIPERRWFRVSKVTGTPNVILSSDGNDVDIEIGELRFGEKKDLLVEIEMSLAEYEDSFRGEGPPQSHSTATDAFFLSKGMDPSTLGGLQPSYEQEYDGMPDNLGVFEVNVAYRDSAAGKNISRLNPTPCLLSITVTPPILSGSRAPPIASAPEIVRRRMELLCSDMLTRSLHLMSRRNDNQAQRLLQETLRIISTIHHSLLSASSSSLSNTSSLKAARRLSCLSPEQSIAQATLVACSEDVAAILKGCEDRERFELETRNVCAALAVVLRDQRSWTPRTAVERLFFHADNAVALVSKSQSWIS